MTDNAGKTDAYAETMRRGLPSGTEYAAAVGLIGSIVRPSTVDLTDAERLARVGWVLDALDRVLAETPTGDIEDDAPRGTDDAEDHTPKPGYAAGYAHRRGEPWTEES